MSLLTITRNYWDDFISLLFPRLCNACEEPLVKGEQTICLRCIYELPETRFHQFADNEVAKKFWGRVDIENATAMYHFTGGGRVQQLIHNLKYNHRKDVAFKVGQLLGDELKPLEAWQNIDIVVPVPLHKRKLRKRGFNQSDYFARGLAESLKLESLPNALTRVKHTQTQTKKSREERWLNVKDVFSVHQPEKLKGKHVLLVDDVITTGATLEACAKQLLKVKNVRVSIATIATA